MMRFLPRYWWPLTIVTLYPSPTGMSVECHGDLDRPQHLSVAFGIALIGMWLQEVSTYLTRLDLAGSNRYCFVRIRKYVIVRRTLARPPLLSRLPCQHR